MIVKMQYLHAYVLALLVFCLLITNCTSEFGWRRCVLRSMVVAMEAASALTIPDFGLLVNLVGASTITLLSFILPVLCYLRLHSSRDPALLPQRYCTVLNIEIHTCTVLILIIAPSLTTNI